MKTRVVKLAPAHYVAEVWRGTRWHLVDERGHVVASGGIACGADRIARSYAQAMRWLDTNMEVKMSIKQSIDYVLAHADDVEAEDDANLDKHLGVVWDHCVAKLGDELEALVRLEDEQRWQLEETQKRKAALLKAWRAGDWSAIGAVFTSDELEALHAYGGMEQEAPGAAFAQHRCASPNCPGFSWKASERPHPCKP